MDLYIETEGGPLLFVDVRVRAGRAISVPDLSKLISTLWPGIDPERIWIYQSQVFHGIRLMHMDAPGAVELSEKHYQWEKRP